MIPGVYCPAQAGPVNTMFNTIPVNTKMIVLTVAWLRLASTRWFIYFWKFYHRGKNVHVIEEKNSDVMCPASCNRSPGLLKRCTTKRGHFVWICYIVPSNLAFGKVSHDDLSWNLQSIFDPSSSFIPHPLRSIWFNFFLSRFSGMVSVR